MFLFANMLHSQHTALLRLQSGYREIDENGSWAGKFINSPYSILHPLDPGKYIIYNDTSFYYARGIMYSNGKIMLPYSPNPISLVHNDNRYERAVAFVILEDQPLKNLSGDGDTFCKVQAYDSTGHLFYYPQYPYVEDLGNDLYLVNEDTYQGDGFDPYYKGGLITYDGKMLLKPGKYMITAVFSNGAYIFNKPGKLVYIYMGPDGERRILK